MSNLIGVDIGGTYTDCVVIGSDGSSYAGKSPTTPQDYAEGIFNALESAARSRGVDPAELWADCERFVHGTTIGTNAIVERTGAKIGLLTTIGHEDVLYIGRGRSAVAGIPEALLTWQSKHYKPRPFAPKRLTRGIVERIDCEGREVIAFNHKQAHEAVRFLLDEGVQAIAVGLLWSFLNPAHELELRDVILEEAPNMFVTLSSELAPKWGEYERLNAAVINSYLGPKTVNYLEGVKTRLNASGFSGAAGLLQCAGGYMPISEAERAPLLTLDSGPIAGVIGTRVLAGQIGLENVIATDMGGTSFDAGIILQGQAMTRDMGLTGQFEYHISRVDIMSIGSGGGSIVSLDPSTGALQVGPRSAGAVPGPVCAGRGGTEPTVTDADVLLGMVNPNEFLGGEKRLDVEGARREIKHIADELSMDVMECAAGIQRIVDHQMAEALRRVSVETGLDPRDFWIFAYGGAGPVHAGAYTRELEARGVIVPQGGFASVWSAWGAASADVVKIQEQAFVAAEPFPADQISVAFSELEDKAVAAVARAGFEADEVVLERTAKMKWRFQVFEIEVRLPAGKLTDDAMPRIVDSFADRYERLFGRNTAYREAGVEITALVVTARGLSRSQAIEPQKTESRKPAPEAMRPSRPVHWWELGTELKTAVLNGDLLRPGDTFEGPAIVESPNTSVVIRPGQFGRIDAYRNVLIEFNPLEST